MSKIRYEETKFGFNWGAANIERCCSHKGYVFLTVRTKRQWLDITVTPSGLIRSGLTKNPTK